jgi:hypothetical protein
LTHGKHLADVVVIVNGQRNLLQVIGALHAPRRLAGGLNSRQQQGDQNANDGNHHQQLH